METTLTLNDGTDNIAFGHKRTEDGVVLWTAPSLTGDFDGIRKVTRKAVRTKGQILTRTIELVSPILDAETGKYTYVQARLIVSAPAASPIALAEKSVNMLLATLNTAVNATNKAEFIAGVEAQ